MVEVDQVSDSPRALAEPPAYRRWLPGDRFPDLTQACGDHPNYAFVTAAGRYQLYALFLSLDYGRGREDLAAIERRRDLFDDEHCSYFGVTVAPRDRSLHGLRNIEPGIRFVWDFDHRVSHELGALPLNSTPGQATPARPQWILVDPSLHIVQTFLMRDTSIDEVIAAVEALPPPDRFGGVRRPPPVMMLPNVFDPDLCRDLIAAYDAAGGEESGVHREGQGVLDFSFKRRQDHIVKDLDLIGRANAAISRRVTPEIERVWFMKVDYIERHIVGCYSAEHGGHFAPHIDNGQGLSSHRRFAVSINLTNDFDGGAVYFPEYGESGHKAPAGWALIFPCGILHAVQPVTRGTRYAFLPFLFDEAGRAIRDRELARIAEGAAPSHPS